MPEEPPKPLPVVHRFIDEVGDTTFYGKGKEVILGQEGVSLVFGMSIVKFGRPIAEVRSEIVALQKQVESDPLLNTIPSVVKRAAKGGFFFHACKDSDDVRTVFLHYLRDLKCEAEIVIARKIHSLFVNKHHGKDDEFYADVLAHLIKNRLKQPRRIVLNIAERGSSTRGRVLDDALAKATGRAGNRWGSADLKAEVVFNVQTPLHDPLLAVPDYLGWAVQRVFEKGQPRYYDYLREKIRLVVDLYDSEKYAGNKNYYDQRNPLTAQNKIGPPST
ncbi:MAG: hypothetical protein HZA89_02190 [Verrucomicrobia bacterium]|nr:hypothetical protein [Verrucomicrobiota bacterium]